MADPQTESRGFGRYFKDAGLFGITQQLLKLTSLATLPILTKKLGVEQYGLFALFNTAAGLAVWFILWSFPSATVRLLSAETDRKKVASVHITALLLIVGSGLVWLAIAWPFLAPLAGLVGVEPTIVVAAILAAITSGAVSLLMTSYRIDSRNKRYAAIDFISGVLFAATIITVALTSTDILWVMIGVIAFKGTRALLLLVDFLSTYGLAAPSWRTFKPMVSLSAPLLFPQIAGWSMHLADRFLLGALAGPEAVGIYAANYNLPVFVNHLTGAIFFSFTPVFARMWNTDDFDGVRKGFRQTGNAVFGVGIPMIVGMTILGPQIMTLLTTPEIANHSKQIIPFVAIAYLLTALGGFGSEICIYGGRTKALAVLAILAAGLNLVLNSVMIPVWGVLGASVATLAAYTALTTATTVYARRIMTFDLDLRFLGRVLLSATAMALAILSIQHPSPWLALLLIPLGAAVYGLTLYIVSGRPSWDQLSGWIRT
ncbi:MAG: oligosaccharide flippase family protein [Candidatus Latescibacterota bacterium]|nr:oligosaccharide flippase family protein [Candidatus Latescibacterota bacterium]